MYRKFPQNGKRIIVTNGKSSYEGTISYTKNIDLSEDGVIKLAPPMCRVYSSGDDSNFALPIDIFSWSSGNYKVITTDNAFNLSLSALTATEDSGGAGSGFRDTSRVVQWVSGNWFINQTSAVYDYTGATATTVYTSRIGTVLNFIEPFVNRNSLVGVATTQNVLKQYDSSFANTTDLTVPANLEITGAAYSNNMMGVITRQIKNRGDAYFFTWDGTTTSANFGYPVNDPYILDIAAYKSSWVLFTSKGELLYFNGGGFERLGILPSFDLNQQIISLGPGNAITFGKIIQVSGDKIYVNCASLPEIADSRSPYTPFFSGGAYCYDPKVGFYHIHAPSYSEYKEESATRSGNILTFSSAHYLETGDEVWPASTDFGLTAERIYYAIKLTDTTIKIADTYEDALNDEEVTLTGTGALFFVKRLDYGIEAIRLQDLGLVKNERDYSGFFNSGALPFFIGAQVHPNALSSARVPVLNVAVQVMQNRGYFVLGKFQTDSLDDVWQDVAVKYGKLKGGDKIVVKAKTRECEPTIVGDKTLYNSTYSGDSVTWDANGKYFETTVDLSNVSEGDEVHIFAGAGAGQSAHIESIEQVGSVWQVTLDEKVRGITSNAKSCVSIDCFKKLGVITHEDELGVKKLPIDGSAPSVEVKIELRGRNVKVYEVQVWSETDSDAG